MTLTWIDWAIVVAYFALSAGIGLVFTKQGGEIVLPPYQEGDLWVATFRDPAGNLIGVWQSGAR